MGDEASEMNLKATLMAGSLTVLLFTILGGLLIGAIGHDRSVKAVFADGGTVVSKDNGAPLEDPGFYVDVEPNGRDVSRVRVEVTEAEWDDLTEGGAFPARSNALRGEAGQSAGSGAGGGRDEDSPLVVFLLAVVITAAVLLAL